MFNQRVLNLIENFTIKIRLTFLIFINFLAKYSWIMGTSFLKLPPRVRFSLFPQAYSSLEFSLLRCVLRILIEWECIKLSSVENIREIWTRKNKKEEWLDHDKHFRYSYQWDKIGEAEQNKLSQMLLLLILKHAISNNFMLKLQKHLKWNI